MSTKIFKSFLKYSLCWTKKTTSQNYSLLTNSIFSVKKVVLENGVNVNVGPGGGGLGGRVSGGNVPRRRTADHQCTAKNHCGVNGTLIKDVSDLLKVN